MHLRPFVAVLVLATTFAFASDVREAAAPMRHAENDFQPHAHGGISIREGSDFDRFSVAVEGVSELVTLSVQMGDGHEHFNTIATLEAGLSNRHIDMKTTGGGHLPYEVAHVADLVGRGVRIVDGEAHLILVGEVPHFSTEPPPPPPAETVTTRSALLRPDGSELRDARGIVVASHGVHGDLLRFEFGHLAAETSYLVSIGEGDAAVLIGDPRTNGEGGAAFGREAAAGADLAAGLPSLAEIAGRRVEVRTRDSVLVLYGHVPGAETAHDAEPVHEEHAVHDEHSGADVHITVDLHPHEGHERLDIEMNHLPRDGVSKSARRARADVFLADASGSLVPVDSVRVTRRGHARLRYTTRRGGNLPLDAATLRELAGRAFEVRVGGRTAVAGSLPNF